MNIVMRVGHVWADHELAANCIALDGAVAGPLIDPENRRYSFDHHQGCIRLITAATCQQVLDALLLGLDPSEMTVLLNDIDGDTALSLWLLRHHERWRDSPSRERARALVAVIAAGDAHGPAFPVSDPALAEHFHVAILEPVRKARPAAGRDEEARATLEECLARLDEWWEAGLHASATLPSPGVLPQLTRFASWVLADAGNEVPGIVPAGARWLYEQGFDRFVLCIRNAAGRYRYTLARRSDLVTGFPLPAIYIALNVAERAARHLHGGEDHLDLDPKDRWGGGSSIGGSPRSGGSVLCPSQVAEVVESLID